MDIKLKSSACPVVRFLLSDEGGYINAAKIVVDGGNITSQRWAGRSS